MKRLFGTVVLMILCCFCLMVTKAEDGTAMDPAAESFLSRAGLTNWTDDGKARLIQCFDVSGQSEIALGF